jgi:hypothetical protein
MSSFAILSSTSQVSNDMIFPSPGMQLLSALTQFLGKRFPVTFFVLPSICTLGVSIMAHCLSRRIASEELSSLRGWKDLTWARVCVLLAFLDSWLFLFTCACRSSPHLRGKDADVGRNSWCLDFWSWP